MQIIVSLADLSSQAVAPKKGEQNSDLHYFLAMSAFRINTHKATVCKPSSSPSIEKAWGKGNPAYDGTLSVVVLGASGNLAMLKV